jgi:hypothetical protein
VALGHVGVGALAGPQAAPDVGRIERPADGPGEFGEDVPLDVGERVRVVGVDRQDAVEQLPPEQRKHDDRLEAVLGGDVVPGLEGGVLGDGPDQLRLAGPDGHPRGTPPARAVVVAYHHLVEVSLAVAGGGPGDDLAALRIGLADPGEPVGLGLRDGLTDRPLDPGDRDGVDEPSVDLADQRVDAFLASGPPPGPVGGDRVRDPVGEDGVLVAAGRLLEVVGHAGGDRLARHPLVALAGEQDERDLLVAVPYRLEERQAVRPGHLVVRDDAVDPLGLEHVEPGLDAGHAGDLEPVVLAFEEPRGQFAERPVVVDVEDPDRVGSHVHRPLCTMGPVHPPII